MSVVFQAARASLGLVILGLLALTPPASASETEAREFTIQVDGKASGHYIATITKQDNGIISMQATASTEVTFLLKTYRYKFEGTEHWAPAPNGRLLQLTAKCEDDGKKFDVSAMAEKETLRLTVNGKERNCRWDVWTTSYFQLPDKRFHDKQVPLLDNDTGKEYLAQLKVVGVEQLNIGGQMQKCQHFRLTGGPAPTIDLWYDGQDRLVREEFTEDGKRVTFVLQAVRR
jgi:hypothetical protein